MPVYQIDLPDGSYEVESPTELTDEQAYNAALANQSPATETKGDAKDEPSTLGAAGRSLIRSAAPAWLGGVVGGAVQGALAGSEVPVWGNIIGGLAGAAIAMWGGSKAQEKLGDAGVLPEMFGSEAEKRDVEAHPIASELGGLAWFKPNPAKLYRALRGVGTAEGRELVKAGYELQKELSTAAKSGKKGEELASIISQNPEAFNAFHDVVGVGGNVGIGAGMGLAQGESPKEMLTGALTGSLFNDSWLGHPGRETRGTAGVHEAAKSAMETPEVFDQFGVPRGTSEPEFIKPETPPAPENSAVDEARQAITQEDNPDVKEAAEAALDAVDRVSESRKEPEPAEGQETQTEALPRIVAATYTDPEGTVHEGENHIEAAKKAGYEAPAERADRETADFGFRLSDGRVINRADALILAGQNGQLKPDAQIERGNLHSDQVNFTPKVGSVVEYEGYAGTLMDAGGGKLEVHTPDDRIVEVGNPNDLRTSADIRANFAQLKDPSVREAQFGVVNGNVVDEGGRQYRPYAKNWLNSVKKIGGRDAIDLQDVQTGRRVTITGDNAKTVVDALLDHELSKMAPEQVATFVPPEAPKSKLPFGDIVAKFDNPALYAADEAVEKRQLSKLPDDQLTQAVNTTELLLNALHENGYAPENTLPLQNFALKLGVEQERRAAKNRPDAKPEPAKREGKPERKPRERKPEERKSVADLERELKAERGEAPKPEEPVVEKKAETAKTKRKAEKPVPVVPAERVSVNPATDELLGTNDRGEPVYWSDNAKTHYAISDGRVRTAPWIEGLPEGAINRLNELIDAKNKSEPPVAETKPKPQSLEAGKLPEQMTPEEFEKLRAGIIALYDESAMPPASEAQKKAEFKVQMLEGELKRARTLEGGTQRGVRRSRGAVKTEADLQKELDEAKAIVADEKAKWDSEKASKNDRLKNRLQSEYPEAISSGLVWPSEIEGKPVMMNKVSLPSSGKDLVRNAIREYRPVSAIAVDSYGIKLPEGYVREGDLYVHKPETKPPVAETKAPESETVVPESATPVAPDETKPLAIQSQEEATKGLSGYAVEAAKSEQSSAIKDALNAGQPVLASHFADYGITMPESYEVDPTTGIATKKGFTNLDVGGKNGGFVDSEAIMHGLKRFAEGVKDFAEWSREMIGRFGEAIKDHLGKLWDHIKEAVLPKEIRDALADPNARQFGLGGLLKNPQERMAELNESFKEAGESLKEKAKQVHDDAKELIGAARSLPKFTDAKKAINGFVGQLQTDALRVNDRLKDFTKAVPSKSRQEAITLFRQADGDDALLAKWSADTKSVDPHFSRIAEVARNLTPEERKWADEFSRFYEEQGNRAVQAGLMSSDVMKDGSENYANHIWKKPVTPAKQNAFSEFAGRLSRSFKFGKQASFENFYEGIMAGFKPQTLNQGDLYGIYHMHLGKTEATNRMIKDMLAGKADDGAPLVTISGRDITQDPMEGPKIIDSMALKRIEDSSGENIRYRTVNDPRLFGWKFLMPNIPSVDVGGQRVPSVGFEPSELGRGSVMKGNLAFHPEIATHVERMLKTSALRNWINAPSSTLTGELLKRSVKLIDTLNSGIKAGMFGFSPFHIVQEATHGVGHKVNPAKIVHVDPDNPDHRDAMNHGLMLSDDSGGTKQFMEGLGSGSIFEKIPVIGQVGKAVSDFTFHTMIPSLKIQTYEGALKRNLERYKAEIQRGEVSVDDVKYLAAKQANDAYGHLNYKDMGRDPTIQHLLRLVTLAPDFLEARFRFALDAAKGFTGAKVGREQAVALGLLGAGFYVTARVLNGLFNDGDTKLDHPFSVVAGDREYSMRSVPEDLYKMVQDPRKFWMGRISPSTRTAIQLGTHRNYRGENVDTMQTLKESALMGIPISAREIPFIRSLTETGKNNPVSPLEGMMSSLGLHINAETPLRPAYDLVNKFKTEHGKPDTGVYPLSQYTPLKNALNSNDYGRARDEFEKLVATEKASHKGMSRSEVLDRLTKSFHSSLFHAWIDDNALNAQFFKQLSGDDRAVMKAAENRRRAMWHKYMRMTGRGAGYEDRTPPKTAA